MINVAQTLVSQYANSPILRQLINDWNADIDPSTNFQDFYTNIWDPTTAMGYGLDIWGRIVGVSRIIKLTEPIGLVFGFRESFGCQPFGQAPFYSPYSAATLTLTDTQFRELIMVKAALNISGCSASDINNALKSIFGYAGKCYVHTSGVMEMHYTFEFELTNDQTSILKYSGVFPAPSGVSVNFLQVDPLTTFGFLGSGFQPFGQGTFSNGVQHVST